MYIRKTKHTNNKTGVQYHTYKLVESIRTQRGPRQRTVLNLGTELPVPVERFKDLANRIESIISRQLPIFHVSDEIEKLAQRYAQKIIRKQGQAGQISARKDEKPDFQSIDINSIENEQIRSVGAESVVLEAIRELGFEQKLEELGFNKTNIETAIGVIAARLIAPASERATHLWLKNNSAIDDMMEISFDSLSQDRVYKISDMLLKNKISIENHLQKQEKMLFDLDEKILLYDLTNTFFEGSGKYNQKARFGLSKEKRKDCLLVTLALLIDSEGFPKKSEFLEGNVSEPSTLKKILSSVSTSAKQPVIVADAGIGTEENTRWMNENGYSYLVVSRKRKKKIPNDIKLIKVRENDSRVIRAAIRQTSSGETELICHSSARKIKEDGIKSRFEKRFEEQLENAQKALFLKRGTKKYDKVLEKIGRLKEKYQRVAHRYIIKVEKDEKSGNANKISWQMKQSDDTSGYYILRTNLNHLKEKEIFDIFTMLLEVEDAFRSMKSELGLRPIHHQRQSRCDGHLFITVLAYHVLQLIRNKLKNNGISHKWSTIRDRLSTHCRVTTSMKRSDGKMLYIRKTSQPEECHIKIYDALNLPCKPGKVIKTII